MPSNLGPVLRVVGEEGRRAGPGEISYRTFDGNACFPFADGPALCRRVFLPCYDAAAGVDEVQPVGYLVACLGDDACPELVYFRSADASVYCCRPAPFRAEHTDALAYLSALPGFLLETSELLFEREE